MTKIFVTLAEHGQPDRAILMPATDVLLLRTVNKEVLNIDGKPRFVEAVSLRLDSQTGEIRARMEYR